MLYEVITAIVGFEANSTILDLARENVARNGMSIALHNAIAGPRVIAEKTPTIDFFVLRAFEASSPRRVSPGQSPCPVPTVPLEDVIAEHEADTLVFDVEGFEAEIVEHTDLSAVTQLIFEIHPKISYNFV